jgi:oxygen-independent coproporphyrinogen-3 oxidase
MKGEAPRNGSPSVASHVRDIGLYIHVPFCRFKCYYCDFNTYAGMEGLIPQYVDALSTEIRRWGTALQADDLTHRLSSVYFGGGTPSLLTPQQLELVLGAVRDSFEVLHNAEITIEANPESVEAGAMRVRRSLGVNRVSMGAQSFQDDQLRMLGRLHDSSRIETAFAELRSAGLDDVSLDLMYGLPGQTMDDWSQSLSRVLALAPEHLSLYALTIEERTPFHRWVEVDSTLPNPDPDVAADMYEEASNRLESGGYRQYEISNWSRPGLESRHNLMYWRNGPFVGVGPGAHSFIGHSRFSVESQPREYLSRIADLKSTPPTSLRLDDSRSIRFIEDIQRVAPISGFDRYTEDMERRETLILGLRLNAGVSEITYETRFGSSPTNLFGPQLEDAIDSGLLERSSNRILRLTPRGRLLANEVFVNLIE